MTEILWLSRHDMTKVQKKALEDKIGPITIRKVDRTFENVQEILSYASHYVGTPFICGVLPTRLACAYQSYASSLNYPLLLMSESNRVFRGNYVNPDTGKEESQYEFVFSGWYYPPASDCIPF